MATFGSYESAPLLSSRIPGNSPFAPGMGRAVEVEDGAGAVCAGTAPFGSAAPGPAAVVSRSGRAGDDLGCCWAVARGSDAASRATAKPPSKEIRVFIATNPAAALVRFATFYNSGLK